MHVYSCIAIYVYVCIHTCVCLYIYTYIYIHANIDHTFLLSPQKNPPQFYLIVVKGGKVFREIFNPEA